MGYNSMPRKSAPHSTIVGIELIFFVCYEEVPKCSRLDVKSPEEKGSCGPSLIFI